MNSRLVLVLLTALLFVQCQQNHDTIFKGESVKKSLEVVAKSRIFFGHQSVGQNIIDGINALKEEYKDTTLQIIDIRKTSQLPEYYFAQTKVGKNTHPESKCDDFANITDHQFKQKGLQYAFLKFCFVDITAQTDIKKVFEYYRQTLNRLKQEHPEICFIHFTVPLRTSSSGIKMKLKQWLGKTDARELNNIKRCQYNQMLKQYYHDEPIFDLAAFESTYPDGKRETFMFQGKKYYALISAYSSDGGHLNEKGRKWIAGKLLSFLADLIRSRH